MSQASAVQPIDPTADQPFDVAVIGGGPAGYTAAIRGAQLGMRVALIEKRDELGGTCLNVGCIPSKALLDSSELYAKARHDMAEHGVVAESLRLDLPTMMRRKDRVVGKLTAGVKALMKANKVGVFTGSGSIAEPGVVTVTAADRPPIAVRATSIVLATGSRPQSLAFLPFDGRRVISSTEALSLAEPPARLVIVGAGVIGLELGSVWRRLGSEVIVVEIMDHIMHGWDEQVQKLMQRELAKQGLQFQLSTTVNAATVTADSVTLHATDAAGAALDIGGDVVLVAVGRVPYCDDLGLEQRGVRLDGRQVAVDRHYRTNVPGVYAIGDIIAGPMLAHKAAEEAVAVMELLAGKAGHVNYAAIPNVVYTWPEAASVGETEAQLAARGVAFRKGTFPFAANGRAIAMQATAGFCKILADAATDRILGAHIVGPWASDLIGELVVAIEFGGSSEDLARSTHAHPTLSEAIKEAALAVDRRSLNSV